MSDVTVRQESPRPRLLVFAYACEPGAGSEPGAGWGVVRTLAQVADCVVLVGPEHATRVRAWQDGGGQPGVRFVVVPDVAWPPPARRGRIVRFLAYLAWLRHARRVGARLHAEHAFDAAHHATYSVYWLPSPAVQLGVPAVLGPVGGAVATPLALWPLLGPRGVAGELFDWVVVRALAALPATRRGWRKAAAVLVQNETTLVRLPAAVRARATVVNHALFTDPAAPPAARGADEPRGSYLLFAAALERRKGGRLAIRALARTPADVRLVVAGDGPQRRELEALAARLRVSDRVEFLGRVPRERVLALMSGAAAVLFTGLREEGGLALAEALFGGVPVVVVAHGGARTIAAAATSPAWVALVAPARPGALADRLAAAMTRFAREPRPSAEPLLDRATAVAVLHGALAGALERRGAGPGD